jgi:hypothetical protein
MFLRLRSAKILVVVGLVTVIGVAVLRLAQAAPVPGDLNQDGVVNVSDLSILLSDWGTSNATADINHDGTVNVLDLSILLAHWGQTAPTPSATPTPTPNPNGTTVTINKNSPEMTSKFLPGVDLTQQDTNNVVSGEVSLVGQGLGWTNVYIEDWGTFTPEPTQGVYNWTSLDGRIALMRQTKTNMMISLCCAPAWMDTDNPSGPLPNTTSTFPTPSHYAAFAALSAQIAARYPDVKYFSFWNELKGTISNVGAFMTLYNQTYQAVIKVRPDAQMGGPYMGLGYFTTSGGSGGSVITTWLNQKNGGEFVAEDGGRFTSTTATQDFTDAQSFIDFATWLRKQPNSGATLPFGWTEWYPWFSQNWADLNHFNALQTNAMIFTLRSGAFYANLWGLNGGLTGSYHGGGDSELLISGGKPTPFYYSMQELKNYFGPGTVIYNSTASNGNVTVLASLAKTMLVNHLGTNQTVIVDGTTVNMTPYQVTVIDTP